MTPERLSKLSGSELALELTAVAKKLGEAINYWMPTAKLSKDLLSVQNEIRARSREYRLSLAPLLEDQNRYVQYYAARQLLALVPGRSRQIIEENSRQGDAIAGDAGMLLYTIDSGIYKPE